MGKSGPRKTDTASVEKIFREDIGGGGEGPKQLNFKSISCHHLFDLKLVDRGGLAATTAGPEGAAEWRADCLGTGRRHVKARLFVSEAWEIG